MQLDAEDLAEFYGTPLGQVARRLIMRRIRLIWPDLRDMRVLGFGFATPYLRPFIGEAERAVALMPAQQGVIAWPEEGRALTALGEEEAFPFPDSMFDRILMVHGIEGTEAARPLMRQIWRVMAPEGRLLLIAPNRASLWAQIDRSPFANGGPFLRAQLDVLLRKSLFKPERWDNALYMPPLKSRRLIGTGEGWEKFGRRLWPGLAGVHLVEASKSLAAVVPIKAVKAQSGLARA
ncbi:MAG TPA: methyltransferase domain-containing protein [Rhizomicrobium sp.]|nr:methyltransferase domain-containing protein [Rhizomicrobium sp.]